MKFKALAIVLILALVFIGCSDEKQEETAQGTNQTQMAPDAHKVVVKEVLHANAYTYLRVDENGKEDWIAITKRGDIEEGMTLYYSDAMEMKNFHSTDLDKDFESVWFVQTISDQPLNVNPSMGRAMPHSNVKPKPVEDVKVDPVAGGITIAQLFDNKSSYNEKSVKIRGKVVKVNNGIMGRNWVHIQDGTGDESSYDLTITTDATLQVGQIVVVEGFVTLDKDFGSGYKYDVILEDSKVTPEASM